MLKPQRPAVDLYLIPIQVDPKPPFADNPVIYEYAPFFALQKKTLLGARAEYEWSPDFRFGSTFLFKSDKTQERKPKGGQETARTIILDGDMSLRLHPTFLTKVADAVPLVETESPSNLSIIAEVAQSRPNPNVDGVAYVDDFETALEELSLGTTRTRWKPATRPFFLSITAPLAVNINSPPLASAARCRLWVESCGSVI